MRVCANKYLRFRFKPFADLCVSGGMANECIYSVNEILNENQSIQLYYLNEAFSRQF